MARKFLSFLGTSSYSECTYCFAGMEKEKYTSKFIQEALVKIVCDNWDKDDKVIIFLTRDAEKENWYNDSDISRRLKTNLESVSRLEVIPISIPDGKTEEEIWEIFDIVSDQIEEYDEIIFDITHSFRSIPMLALVVLNYVKVVKSAKILGIYYGAFDAKNSDNVAPIFDLTPLDEILEWSQAVNTFLRYGNTGHLKDISINVLKPNLANKEKWAQDTGKFIDSLNDLTMCLYTCRGMIMDDEKGANRKSISSASTAVKNNLEKIDKIDGGYKLKPLVPLLKKIKERTDLFNESDNLSLGISSTKWYIDNNLIQQAYTALDETMKTYICVRFGLNSSSKDDREEIAQKALKIKERKIPEDKWDVKPEYLIKVKELVEELDCELVALSGKIGNRRNDINHFGFNNDSVTYNSLLENVNNYYKEFINYVKKHENA